MLAVWRTWSPGRPSVAQSETRRSASTSSYDTLVRRAQFYIDHEWFLEAGEALPTHKEPPPHGGRNRRFQMTSGHNRWSIHSMNMTNNVILNTHRGGPFVFITH